jgi:hypothetical protein
MNPEKTHTVEKNKNLLYQLEGLIKTLYPNHKTTNPYEEYLQDYYNELNIEDVLLFKRLLKSITLLNHKERPQDNRRYISSYGDVLTTIELMSRCTINDVLLRSYVQLKDIFLDRPFTQLQATRVLRKSPTTIKRYINLWMHLRLIKKSRFTQGKKHMYELIGYQLPSYEDMEQNL